MTEEKIILTHGAAEALGDLVDKTQRSHYSWKFLMELLNHGLIEMAWQASFNGLEVEASDKGREWLKNYLSAAIQVWEVEVPSGVKL
jgi:hypothetical protein